MASISRTALLGKVYKILKKHYKPVQPNLDRPVLEQLLFACCLENAPYQQAEEAFDALGVTFFDWNEVRVSTVDELAEAVRVLPDPAGAARRLKRVLQSIFESGYTFDLEDMRKQNLGPATTRLKKTDGSTPFSVNYVVQTALGGHAIPVDQGAFEAFQILGAISAAEAKAGHVPGIERAIPKNKGLDFASLLHQLAADFSANPYSPAIHKILLEIQPDAKDRLPRRTRKRPAKSKAATVEKSKPAEGKGKKAARGSKKKTKATAASGVTSKKAATKKAATRKAAAKKAAAKKTVVKKSAAKKKTKAAAKKKSHTSKLSKRKPR